MRPDLVTAVEYAALPADSHREPVGDTTVAPGLPWATVGVPDLEP